MTNCPYICAMIYTVQQFADKHGVSKQSIYWLLKNTKTLRTRKIAGKVFIPEQDYTPTSNNYKPKRKKK